MGEHSQGTKPTVSVSVCVCVRREREGLRGRERLCLCGRKNGEERARARKIAWSGSIPKSHRLANRVVNPLPPNTGIVEGSVSNGPGRPRHFSTSLRPAGQAYSYFRAKKWTCGLTRRTNYSALVFVYTRRPPASRCASFYILCSVLLHFFLLMYLLFVPK